MIRHWLWILVCVLTLVGGCTSDGIVRDVDGMYRKVYPDEKQGGWYYVNGQGEKVHLDRLPPERNIYDTDTQYLRKPNAY